jgi:hypothetical protein
MCATVLLRSAGMRSWRRSVDCRYAPCNGRSQGCGTRSWCQRCGTVMGRRRLRCACCHSCRSDQRFCHGENAESSPLLTKPLRPPVYDAFLPEDRALFIDCKQRLGPARLNEVTKAAVEWLTERCDGNPEAFSDELLRDKIDEFIFNEVFRPERRRQYEHLFFHLSDNAPSFAVPGSRSDR